MGYKVGDRVKIKPGVVGAGQTGVIEKIEPWNLNSPLPELRENFHYVLIEDGVRAKFTADLLVKLPKYRSIDDEWAVEC